MQLPNPCDRLANPSSHCLPKLAAGLKLFHPEHPVERRSDQKNVAELNRSPVNLGWIQMLRTYIHAIHDGVATE